MSDTGMPRCRRCDKDLRSSKSIAAKIGPVCLKKEQQEGEKGRSFKGCIWDQPSLFDQVEVRP